MPVVDFQKSVPYSAQQMLDLVADVESYPDFVPNCADMDVIVDAADPNRCVARMAVSFGPISQSYASRVTVNRERGTVTAEAVDGPFSHLKTVWTISPAGEGSTVQLHIDFGFSNRLIAAVAEPAFANKQQEVLDAFLDEAARRYG